jgi:hypothetical protein
MVRPRWHDAVLVAGIVGLLAVGVWSLWWDDVRSIWQPAPGSGDAAAPMARSQT